MCWSRPRLDPDFNWDCPRELSHNFCVCSTFIYMARTKQHPSYNGGKAPRMQVLFCFALLHCVTSSLPILELILLTIDNFYFFSSLMHGTSSSWLLKQAVESQCLIKNTPLAQLKRSIVTDQEPLPFVRSVVIKRVPTY